MIVLASSRMNGAQLPLQTLARLGIERAEGFVHQQDSEPAASVRAIATRWRMPPEMRLG